jgi:hypothetical protein
MKTEEEEDLQICVCTCAEFEPHREVERIGHWKLSRERERL